jgi:hypothetical protein
MSEFTDRIRGIDWADQFDQFTSAVIIKAEIEEIIDYNTLVEAAQVTPLSVSSYACRYEGSYDLSFFDNVRSVQRSLSSISRNTSLLDHPRQHTGSSIYCPSWPILVLISNELATSRKEIRKFCDGIKLASGDGVEFSCCKIGDRYQLSFDIMLPDQDSCRVVQDRLLEIFTTFETLWRDK